MQFHVGFGGCISSSQIIRVSCSVLFCAPRRVPLGMLKGDGMTTLHVAAFNDQEATFSSMQQE